VEHMTSCKGSVALFLPPFSRDCFLNGSFRACQTKMVNNSPILIHYKNNLMFCSPVHFDKLNGSRRLLYKIGVSQFVYILSRPASPCTKLSMWSNSPGSLRENSISQQSAARTSVLATDCQRNKWREKERRPRAHGIRCWLDAAWLDARFRRCGQTAKIISTSVSECGQ
jgi:hypothetical protein